jgi:hypothetical protein
MNQSAAVVAVISQMITPAIFILAVGNLINGALTQVARAVDRVRALLEQAAACKGADEALYQRTLELLHIHQRRTKLVEFSLSCYYSAIGLFVAASLSVAVDVFTANHVPWLATALTVIGALSLLSGSVSMLIEVRLATSTVRLEIDREIRRLETAI